MAKFLNISEASSIALHGMMLLVRSDKPLNANQIADALGASRHHVSKVFLRLVKFHYVKSSRGPAGGYSLNRPAKDLTFLDIYEAIEGEIIVCDECPFSKEICAIEDCIFSDFFQKVVEDFRTFLGNKTLEDCKTLPNE